MVKKTQPYECVCCGYETSQKNDMRKHLYKKKPCPKSVNDVELTDEIREHILENRVYQIQKPPTIVQTIQYNNTINNFIAGLDAIEKLTKYASHANVAITELSETIEERLSKRALALESKRDGMQLLKEDMFDIIDQVTSLSNGRLQDFNILYDKKYEKLRMYDDGAWKDFLMQNGCKALLLMLQDTILDSYERYLVQKLKSAKPYEACRLRGLLEEYYRFLGCFDVPPYAKQHSDQSIMESENFDDSSFEIAIECMDLYEEVSNKLTKSSISDVRKEVVKILQRNTRKNVDDLNKRVVELFKMDEAFKISLQS